MSQICLLIDGVQQETSVRDNRRMGYLSVTECTHAIFFFYSVIEISKALPVCPELLYPDSFAP
ncbi:Uncharacterized protein APZ42_032327 [Daphnia magna]|uniref:Uncharacterized protein n=1 Tax=Daphnia magna TaxID=35525 RepID=A0A164M2U5_9CRUS|nr:Uncharacterized protein APZ42_032327 [Daphnia magna]